MKFVHRLMRMFAIESATFINLANFYYTISKALQNRVKNKRLENFLGML